ncbi:immunity 22 family protein [Chitinophaga varians]|uniref:immunity 22 family protein n=1 Tax=Chitinophaga varians TaxID=2202339 RepID=UPI00165FF589|nr:immunity 22 family protein [Chitinophaga varians]MBC9911780.1 immunity 22 family protein [Chitinophaga varians]
MGKMHIWTGNFESEAALEKYLDQKEYLAAWAVYDNGLPAKEDVDASMPDPALRCAFCEEIGIDFYDEDAIIVRYYDHFVEVTTVAHDTLTDKAALEKLWKKQLPNNVNVVIAYEDKNLNAKNATKTSLVDYLGKVGSVTANSAEVHHLWVGERETLSEQVVDFMGDAKAIIKATGINKEEVIKVNLYYNDRKEKLDEMIITQVEDFSIAEDMILKVDKMDISATANALLDLVARKGSAIDGLRISAALGMRYIGRFEGE